MPGYVPVFRNGAANVPAISVNSTALVVGIFRVSSTGRTSTFASTDLASVVSTFAVSGADADDFIVVNTSGLSTAWAIGEAWMTSTDGEGKLKLVKASTASGATTEQFSVNVLVCRF